MSSLSETGDGRNAAAVLERLAAALGGTVDSLFGPEADASANRDANELISLWLSLRSARARARILASARAAVAAQDA